MHRCMGDEVMNIATKSMLRDDTLNTANKDYVRGRNIRALQAFSGTLTATY